MKQATHVLWNYPSQKTTMLFRASDGVMVGQQKDETVVYGENPNRKSSRVFIDIDHAAHWLKQEVALADLRANQPWWKRLLAHLVGSAWTDPVVIETDKENGIYLAPDSIEIPSGAIHPMRNRTAPQKMFN